MAERDHVVAFRSSSLPEAEMVLELLRGEGLAARLIRPQGILAGAALNLYETRIEVPASSAAHAAELLADLEVLGSSEEMDRGHDVADEPRPRLPIIAAGIGLLFPGGSHLYARRPWTTLVVALGFVIALALRAAAADPVMAQFSFVMMLAVVASDLTGGLWALGSTNGDQKTSRSSQIGRGLILVGTAIALAAGVTAVLDAPRRARVRMLARFSVTCTPDAIQIVNGSDEARFVNVRLTVFPIPVPRTYHDIALPVKPSRLALEAHARGETTYYLLDSLRTACAGGAPARADEPPSLPRLFGTDESATGRPITGCALWTQLEIEPSVALGFDGIEASGGCLPRWGEPGWMAPVPLREISRR
jgi:hypothetical protein